MQTRALRFTEVVRHKAANTLELGNRDKRLELSNPRNERRGL